MRLKKAKSVLLQNEINKTNADSTLILESIRHYFNLIRSQAFVEVSEAQNEFHGRATLNKIIPKWEYVR